MFQKNDRTGTCVPKMIEQEQVFQNDRAVTCVPKMIQTGTGVPK